MKKITSYSYAPLSTVFLSLALLGIFPVPTSAQTPGVEESTTSGEILSSTPAQSTEGISGSVDKKHRNPIVTLSTEVRADNVKILVDASIPAEEYQVYPIQFDFYVNRKLFASQIRSKELPGAIGIDVGPDIATPPFNYSVVATLLHPNRQFVTVAQGAVTPASVSSTLDCTLTTQDSIEGTTLTYSATSIVTEQGSEDGVSFSFTATSTDGETKEVSASLTFGESLTEGERAVSGTVTTGEEESAAVTGTEVDSSSNGIESLEVATPTDSLVLSCTKGTDSSSSDSTESSPDESSASEEDPEAQALEGLWE